MSVRCWLLIVCASLCAVSAPAQTATLLKDINTTVDGAYSSEPGPFTELRGIAYFFASSGPDVRGLWRTDGTASGTWLVKNHLSGFNITEHQGLLLFAADDGIHGSELWRSDGTPEGTTMVKDIVPGSLGAVREGPRMVSMGGALFFQADVEGIGQALWKTDATEAGTVPVKDLTLYRGPIGSLLGSVEGVLYLAASDEVNGVELWRSDGTSAGTTLIRDINPGPESSEIYNVVFLNDVILFSAVNPNYGYELWRSDGTTSGTNPVIDLAPSGNGVNASHPQQLTVFNNMVYFPGDNGDGSGIGLWRTDGTVEGTQRVVQGVRPFGFASLGNTLYFLTDGGNSGTAALWRTDGTMLGSSLVQEFPGGANPRRPNASPYGPFAKLGGAVYFMAAESPGDYELWKADATGAVVISQLGDGGSGDTDRSAPFSPFLLRSNSLVSGKLLFTADDGVHGEELWISNGSISGTVLVQDIGQEAGSSNPFNFQKFAGELYFTAVDNSRERVQWSTDGTAEGTRPTQTTPPVIPSPGFYAFDDGANGRELWITDGTESGARLVKDVNPGPANGLAEKAAMLQINRTLFFAADDGVNGTELWRSDGTLPGTMLVKDVHPQPGMGSMPTSFADLNGTLIFHAAGPTSSNELWRSDGTELGTVLVKNIGAAFGLGGLREVLASAELVYFLTWHPGSGYWLWRTDGSEDGTFQLMTTFGAFEPQPELALLNGTLLISRQTETQTPDGSRFEGSLWRFDGTVEGTMLLKGFDAVSNPVAVANFTTYGRRLYFLVAHPSGRVDLWNTDGTPEGTARSPIGPTEEHSVERILGVEAGSLFLEISEGRNDLAPRHIARLQASADRALIDDVAFVGGSFPAVSLPHAVGSHVVFSGRTQATGVEPWSLPLQPSISANGVVDAAGYQPTLAPGSLASLFGVELSGETAAATSFPLPTTLGGAKVQVNGIDAPLIFVSPTQINFQVPYGTPLGASVSVVTWLNGQQSTSQPTAVAEFAPALFLNPATDEPIVQRHADGSLITAANPALPGDTLVLYVTGIGGLDNPPPTGAAATDDPLASATTTPTVLVGGVEATVLFAGLAPDFAGLGQINIVLPQGLPQGSSLPLSIRFGSAASPTTELPF